MADRKTTQRQQRPEKAPESRQNSKGRRGARKVGEREDAAKVGSQRVTEQSDTLEDLARRLQADRPEENRSFAETLGGTQFAPQGRAYLGALDADLFCAKRHTTRFCRRPNARGWSRPK